MLSIIIIININIINFIIITIIIILINCLNNHDHNIRYTGDMIRVGII